MDDISKIPRLPGDGAQDDTQFEENLEPKQFGSNRSSLSNCSLNGAQSIEGLTRQFFNYRSFKLKILPFVPIKLNFLL